MNEMLAIIKAYEFIKQHFPKLQNNIRNLKEVTESKIVYDVEDGGRVELIKDDVLVEVYIYDRERNVLLYSCYKIQSLNMEVD